MKIRPWCRYLIEIPTASRSEASAAHRLRVLTQCEEADREDATPVRPREHDDGRRLDALSPPPRAADGRLVLLGERRQLKLVLGPQLTGARTQAG